jgi:hypothetical protein
MKVITKMLLPCLAVAVAHAQDEMSIENDDQEELRRYQVEVVIFAYTKDVGVGTEYFPPDEVVEGRFSVPVVLEELVDEFADPEADEEAVPDIESGDFSEAEEPPEPPFVLLAEEELTIIGLIDQLDRLEVYEPMMYFGWRQLTYPDEEPRARTLRDFGEPPEGLEGNLTLYLSRYLHLLVDLELAAPAEMQSTPVDDPPVVTFADPRSLIEIEETATPSGPVFYRLREDRILKNGDIRYFDHPKFGVIAKMVRIEEEEVQPEDDELGRQRPLVLLPDEDVVEQ